MQHSLEIKRAKKILRELGIKYRFYWKKPSPYGVLGYYNSDIHKIYVFYNYYIVKENKLIKKESSRNQLLFCIFHEIQHALMYKNNKYITYHKALRPNKDSYKHFLKWAKESYTAEIAADHLAVKMLRRYFPDINAKRLGIYKTNKGKSIVKRLNLDICYNFYYNKYEEFKKVMGY